MIGSKKAVDLKHIYTMLNTTASTRIDVVTFTQQDGATLCPYKLHTRVQTCDCYVNVFKLACVVSKVCTHKTLPLIVPLPVLYTTMSINSYRTDNRTNTVSIIHSQHTKHTDQFKNYGTLPINNECFIIQQYIIRRDDSYILTLGDRCKGWLMYR